MGEPVWISVISGLGTGIERHAKQEIGRVFKAYVQGCIWLNRGLQMNAQERLEIKVAQMEALRKLELWIEELETLTLKIKILNENLKNFLPKEKLSYCCEDQITETGFCKRCGENQ